MPSDKGCFLEIHKSKIVCEYCRNEGRKFLLAILLQLLSVGSVLEYILYGV
jgi:hypothetical protein